MDHARLAGQVETFAQDAMFAAIVGGPNLPSSLKNLSFKEVSSLSRIGSHLLNYHAPAGLVPAGLGFDIRMLTHALGTAETAKSAAETLAGGDIPKAAREAHSAVGSSSLDLFMAAAKTGNQDLLQSAVQMEVVRRQSLPLVDAAHFMQALR